MCVSHSRYYFALMVNWPVYHHVMSLFISNKISRQENQFCLYLGDHTILFLIHPTFNLSIVLYLECIFIDNINSSYFLIQCDSFCLVTEVFSWFVFDVVFGIHVFRGHHLRFVFCLLRVLLFLCSYVSRSVTCFPSVYFHISYISFLLFNFNFSLDS